MNHQPDHPVRKYDIWLADLPAVPESHVQSGVRPVVIVSNQRLYVALELMICHADKNAI